ncbi:uncharacterized protein PV07_08621 [Cladophialophora immunda]|uniref:Protein kinase domain-containing protein n=1 Tax=Cladophialophora immunda TaxID=569365 RepID=A0A0D2AKG0_9EURO|nr:uncharacterized protein PV07_08621 [Cladophialophora immunda]KIW25447.1 hypothetical protein PV07_08621 [Cladophialophora immunda]
MNDFNSLLLEPFESGSSRIHFQTCAGGGKDGYVFKVRIRKKDYALKMFRFDHPGLNVTKLKGTQRNAFYDPFYIECRANGALIQQGLNGQILPFCYGRIDVPTAAEIQVAKRYTAWDPVARTPKREGDWSDLEIILTPLRRLRHVDAISLELPSNAPVEPRMDDFRTCLVSFGNRRKLYGLEVADEQKWNDEDLQADEDALHAWLEVAGCRCCDQDQSTIEAALYRQSKMREYLSKFSPSRPDFLLRLGPC